MRYALEATDTGDVHIVAIVNETSCITNPLKDQVVAELLDTPENRDYLEREYSTPVSPDVGFECIWRLWRDRSEEARKAVKDTAEKLGMPTEGAFALHLWNTLSNGSFVPASEAGEIYRECGYQAFTGYPLQRLIR